MKITKIPLSNDTADKSILEMSSDIEKNVYGSILQYSYFARQVDESTEITNKVQFIAFICFTNENKIKKQFLFAKN